jgi:hypothetical protein
MDAEVPQIVNRRERRHYAIRSVRASRYMTSVDLLDGRASSATITTRDTHPNLLPAPARREPTIEQPFETATT